MSVDLFRLADAAEFAEAVVTSALSNRAAVHQVVRKAHRFGRQALSAAQGAVAVKVSSELGDAVEFALTPGLAADNPQRALAAALELPERIAKADGKRCVVFIDEFQEIANERHPYGDPDALTKQMRAILQRSAQCSYVFAGSIEHIMRDLFAPTDRAFSGFGGLYRLRAITPEDWAQKSAPWAPARRTVRRAARIASSTSAGRGARGHERRVGGFQLGQQAAQRADVVAKGPRIRVAAHVGAHRAMSSRMIFTSSATIEASSHTVP